MEKFSYKKIFLSFFYSIAIAIVLYGFLAIVCRALSDNLNDKMGNYVLFYFYPAVSCWLGYIINNKNVCITWYRSFDFLIYFFVFLACSIFTKWLYINKDLISSINRMLFSYIFKDLNDIISEILSLLIHPLSYLALMYIGFCLIIYFIFFIQNQCKKF